VGRYDNRNLVAKASGGMTNGMTNQGIVIPCDFGMTMTNCHA